MAEYEVLECSLNFSFFYFFGFFFFVDLWLCGAQNNVLMCEAKAVLWNQSLIS